MNRSGENLIRVELHVHTKASFDSLMPIDKLIQRCQTLGIDRVAITDHNVIDAALEAKKNAPELVIVGEEIETTKGELIGYFMSEWVPPGLDPKETIERLTAQGAVISVPHPFDVVRSKHWEEVDLETLVPLLDAIEVFNARCTSDMPNRQAGAFARKHGLLENVGSDAHTLGEIGMATLRMAEFDDAESFKDALRGAQPDTRLSPVFVHLFSTYAKIVKRINLSQSENKASH